MPITLMQVGVEDAAKGLNTLTEGKSEPLTVIILGCVILGFMLWRWEARQNKEDARQHQREEHQYKKDEKDSESLRIVSVSSVKTAEATQMMAKTVKTIELRQHGDRKAIVHVIDALNYQPLDPERAKKCLNDAKTELLNS